MNKPEHKPLDPQTFNSIAGAFSRLQQGPVDPIEAEKLTQYLTAQMLAFAGDFLAAWSLAHTEYLPALSAIQRIALRCGFGIPPSQLTRTPENN